MLRAGTIYSSTGDADGVLRPLHPWWSSPQPLAPLAPQAANAVIRKGLDRAEETDESRRDATELLHGDIFASSDEDLDLFGEAEEAARVARRLQRGTVVLHPIFGLGVVVAHDVLVPGGGYNVAVEVRRAAHLWPGCCSAAAVAAHIARATRVPPVRSGTTRMAEARAERMAA